MKHNFSAGPSILPKEVIEQSAKAVLEFGSTELSLIEVSHRNKDFVEVMSNAVASVKEVLDIPEDYEVLFVQGGASLQFVMTPYNLLPEGGKASYVDTGSWSSKAIKEAKKFGDIDVVASSKDANYNYIPKGFKVSEDNAYLHLTSNNTIFGTQFQEFPDLPNLVCDMSSDIFSRKIDVSKFDLIYAGAQKNLGPAGVTIAIVKKSVLGKTGRDIPTYLNYQTHIDKDSMFNTPPVFATYTSMLTLEWIKKNGGISVVEKNNDVKSSLLYGEIDSNPFFQGVAAKEDRSKMNVTFTFNGDDAVKEAFDTMWKDAGIANLNGHRSVGGYRASIYNAMPISSVKVLVEVMQTLTKKFG